MSDVVERRLTILETAEVWGISSRTVERYVAQLGMPHAKEGGRVFVVFPAAGRWWSLRVLSQSIRKHNQEMTRDEVRRQALAIYLEDQDDLAGFDRDLPKGSEGAAEDGEDLDGGAGKQDAEPSKARNPSARRPGKAK